jgi:hypothetical protein
MTLIRMHRSQRVSLRNSELSRPFKWRFCSETDVVVDVETEGDALKVLGMAEGAWNGRTVRPHRIDASVR